MDVWVRVRVEIYRRKHREFTVAGVAGVGECVTVMPLPELLPSFSGSIAWSVEEIYREGTAAVAAGVGEYVSFSACSIAPVGTCGG